VDLWDGLFSFGWFGRLFTRLIFYPKSRLKPLQQKQQPLPRPPACPLPISLPSLAFTADL
ncbi:MAG: hypothetical protein CMG96_07265, partial [Marinovum sp.]|nr:hypothetical protein [Marinovum sp.]